MSETTTGERRFVFRDGELMLQAVAPDALQPLLVADSWLVDHASVRAIDLHRDRFVGSCLATGFGRASGGSAAGTAELEAFWESAIAAIPPVHRWFPRVELRGGNELALLMRLAPPAASTAVLGTHLGEDPRSIPSIKGPDLGRLTALRNAARGRGVDDLVILAGDASIVDGTTTALLWWRGDELRVPPAEAARVDSVTARTIRVLAQALGVPVAEERATPAAVLGLEVWAVNALYGIRLVTEWVGGPAVAAGPDAVTRASSWQRRLTQLARPLR